MQSLFTESEISRLLGIIDRNIIVLVAKVLGKESLTSLDKLILRQHNIDFNKIASNLPPYWKAYLFGRLTGQLTVPQAAQIDYNNFNKYLIQKQYTPPTSREIAEYRAASRRTYEYIKGMGERQKKALNTFISEGELEYLVETKRQETVKVVKERMDDGILRRQSVQKITSNIGHQLKSWNQDWGRIVETECQNIYTLGTAQNIMDVHGVDARVYFDVFPGACFPTEDTEFLTDEGFKYLKDIRGDERILTYNLEKNKAEYSSIISKIQYEYSGEMHHYKNRRMDLLSTPNHNHLIGRRLKGSKKDIYQNELIPSQDLRGLICRDIMYLGVENWEGNKDKYIQLCGKKIETAAFSEFMGWWLSEGSVSFRRKRKDGSSNMSQISISQTKEINFNEINSCFSRMFPDRNVLYNGGSFVCNLDKSYDELVRWFLKFGYSIEKYIPKEIKVLDKKYLMLFLNAYLKGDGTVGKNYTGKNGKKIGGVKVIFTSSKKMADDLCEVVLKCGYSPSLRERNEIGKVSFKKDGSKIITKHLRYIIGISKKTTIKNINKYFNKIQWSGEVGCLEVEKNNTLFIRRNGKMIWSGNCRHCISLYLTGGIGSRPRIFTVAELLANGTNIGRKSKDWKPVLGTVHPFCRCDLRFIPPGYEWDEDSKKFAPKPPENRVQRKSKVKITVGDLNFEV